MTAPAGQRGKGERDRDAAEGAPGAGAKGGGDSFEALVDALETGAGGADVEGGGDEHLSQDDGGGWWKATSMPAPASGPPTGPCRPRSSNKARPPTTGGRDDGQVDDGVHQGAAGKAPPGQQVGGGSSEGNDGHDGDC